MEKHRKNIGARAVRILLLAAALWLLAVPMLLTNGAGSSALPGAWAADNAQEGGDAAAAPADATPAPAAAPSDPHSMRSASQAAGAEAALEAANKNDRDGVITFDLLRSTELKLVPPPVFPKQLADLDGRKVRIRGFMTPFDNLKDMRNFMLFPFATGCFFCAPPSPREVVFVRVDSKDAVAFESGAIEIEGTLNLWKDGSADKAHQSFLFVVNEAKLKKIGG